MRKKGAVKEIAGVKIGKQKTIGSIIKIRLIYIHTQLISHFSA